MYKITVIVVFFSDGSDGCTTIVPFRMLIIGFWGFPAGQTAVN